MGFSFFSSLALSSHVSTYRYMQESGFVHSAFSFSHESMLGRTSLRSADKTLPPGALITFLQKGLQYVGIEESLQQQNASNPTAATMDMTTNQNQNASNTNTTTSSIAGDNNDTDFSILSPTAIAAISRRNPPIQLNVPPATAAAAVKARLEVEAKLHAERHAAISSQLQANGLLTPGFAGSQHQQLQKQQVLGDPNTNLARQAMAAQAAASHMAALHHQMGGLPDPSTMHAFALQQQQQQQRAEMMALTQIQQQQQHLSSLRRTR
jgi:hypothetical protein